ncbi:class F sortase [soil metagenome]
MTKQALRLRLMPLLAALMLLSLMSGGSVLSQDKIVSSVLGEVPTTGGARPGPVGYFPDPIEYRTVSLPVAIEIANAFVNAQVEVTEIVDGVMLDPSGPWVISWYQESSKLGEIGNILMAGHLDYWDVGPAVLYNVNNLSEGDLISVTGDDGEIYTYSVLWRENFETANAPIQDIVGPTEAESLTIITCGGPFDYENGVYLQRTVVRAERVQA